MVIACLMAAGFPARKLVGAIAVVTAPISSRLALPSAPIHLVVVDQAHHLPLPGQVGLGPTAVQGVFLEGGVVEPEVLWRDGHAVETCE